MITFAITSLLNYSRQIVYVQCELSLCVQKNNTLIPKHDHRTSLRMGWISLTAVIVLVQYLVMLCMFGRHQKADLDQASSLLPDDKIYIDL